MSYEAEQCIIGKLLIDNNAISDCCNTINADMFESAVLGQIYSEVLNAYDNHKAIDAVIITHNLVSQGVSQNLLMSEISACVSITNTSVNISEYANIVLNDFKARTATNLFKMVNISPNNVNEQIDVVKSKLEALQNNFTSEGKKLPQIANENKDLYFVPNETKKIYTGFKTLDEKLIGLEGGNVVVIGARPAVGKSAFALQICLNVVNQNYKVVLYNLEMSEKQIYERVLSSISGIELTRIRKATRYLEGELEAVSVANKKISEMRNFIVVSGSKSARDIYRETKHMKCDILVIDYLQLIKSDGLYNGNRYAEVGNISHTIKAIAMELNIPVILLSQLNRLSTIKGKSEPSMAELRESGDIEQDASIIILLWNSNDDDKTEKGLKIEKNRQGETMKEKLDFDGRHMKFTEISPDSEWENCDESTPFD